MGGLDGAQHGGEGLVAVDEGLDAVAAGEGLTDDPADYVREFFEMLQAGGLWFAQVFRGGLGIGSLYAEQNGAAADAVDAEREIQDRAKHR